MSVAATHTRLVALILLCTSVPLSVRCIRVLDESVQCDPQMMHVFFEFSQPFFGTVYAENFAHSNRCRINGEGGRKVSLSLHLNTDARRQPYCGVQLDSEDNFYAGVIVNEARDIMVQGMRAYTVKCKYIMKDVTLKLAAQRALHISGHHDDDSTNGTRAILLAGDERHTIAGAGGGIAPMLDIAIRDGWSITGRTSPTASIGQPLTLDIFLADMLPYDFVVFNCIAHDGTRRPGGTITLVDEKGCTSVIQRVLEHAVQVSTDTKGIKHVSVYMRAFQFSTSDTVNFECQVRPCIHTCSMSQCTISSSRTRRDSAEQLTDINLSTSVRIRNASVLNSNTSIILQRDDSGGDIVTPTNNNTLRTSDVYMLASHERVYANANQLPALALMATTVSNVVKDDDSDALTVHFRSPRVMPGRLLADNAAVWPQSEPQRLAPSGNQTSDSILLDTGSHAPPSRPALPQQPAELSALFLVFAAFTTALVCTVAFTTGWYFYQRRQFQRNTYTNTVLPK